ncbi:DUF3472 domain-containing protein [Paludibacter sp. 221]|uniref:DUF3472 domain-containing protein n=1 Tax=Paludibacter sp. 221 TaxID=2302939 RepID=UPI0013D52606|nr:DUF3472 domain-containing protein [Paludibacter sp. 221]
MKNTLLFRLIVLLFGAVMLFGCNDDLKEGVKLSADGYDLSKSSSEMLVTAGTTTIEINVKAGKKETWKARFVDGKSDFFTIEPLNIENSGNGKIVLTITSNLTGKNRSDVFMVESESKKIRITVIQNAYDVKISPSKYIEIGKEGGECKFEISVAPVIDLEYKIEEGIDWVLPVEGKTAWNVKAYDLVPVRQAKIYVIAKGTSALLDSIIIQQKGIDAPKVAVLPSKRETYTYAQQKISFEISSEPVAELLYEIEPGVDWIIPIQGENTSWNITKNTGGDRGGKIYIVWKEMNAKIDSIQINQLASVTEETTPIPISIPGNTYVTAGSGVMLATNPDSESGISQWSKTDQRISMYFRVSKPGQLNLGFIGNIASGSSEIKVTVNGKEFLVKLNGASTKFYPIGQMEMEKAGYVRVDFQGVSTTSSYFGQISKLRIGGEATTGTNTYIKDDQVSEWSYWGRRGPSVHMNYRGAPQNVEYFYNEITVPAGNDVIGTYCMTNGFGEGYCGIQVNSASERRVLFSVWAPFETDDPSQIPEHLRVKLLRRGQGVKVGEFGNEGSGGQSYLIYPWKAGVTYRLLTQVKYNAVVEGSHTTDYTAYFFDPQANGGAGKWFLIASFRRPETNKTYTGMHSFLENFSPTQGWITREVYFDNQWVRTLSGNWQELTSANFTHDNTANKGIRLDYYGGIKDDKFMLKNCGYFDGNTTKNTVFTRMANGKAPDIDLEALKNIPSVN